MEIYPKWHEFQENERNGREFQSGSEKFGGSKNDGEDMVIFMSNDGERRIHELWKIVHEVVVMTTRTKNYK